MSLDSPTTARSSSASSSNRSPCLTTAWSSAMTIVMGVGDMAAWSARLGQVGLPGSDRDGLVSAKVGYQHHALADHGQRTVAAVAHAPVSTPDRRRGEPARGAKASLGDTPEQPEHTLAQRG